MADGVADGTVDVERLRVLDERLPESSMPAPCLRLDALSPTPDGIGRRSPRGPRRLLSPGRHSRLARPPGVAHPGAPEGDLDRVSLAETPTIAGPALRPAPRLGRRAPGRGLPAGYDLSDDELDRLPAADPYENATPS